MSGSDTRNTLTVDPAFRAFVEDELLPDLDIEPGTFWSGLADIVAELTPENRRLLAERDAL